MSFVKNDGGREAAGFTGKKAGDCVCRAIAIATERPYQEIYDLILEFAKKERRGVRKKGISHPDTGVYTPTIRKVMAHLGWKWTPCMKVGVGCTVHLRPDELPNGRVVISLSKHHTAVIDGVVHDTYDPTIEGMRCVYGYYTNEQVSSAK